MGGPENFFEHVLTAYYESKGIPPEQRGSGPERELATFYRSWLAENPPAAASPVINRSHLLQFQDKAAQQMLELDFLSPPENVGGSEVLPPGYVINRDDVKIGR